MCKEEVGEMAATVSITHSRTRTEAKTAGEQDKASERARVETRE